MTRRSETVTVRLHDTELAELDRRAAEHGRSRSEALRAAVASPIPNAADAVVELVHRLDTAEDLRDAYRIDAERARLHADERIRDLQAETARREAGLVKALWRALGQEPGTDSQLLDAVAHLAANAQEAGRRP